MDWIAHLLREIPTAASYRSILEWLQRENERLRRENAMLRLRLDALDREAPQPDEQTASEGSVSERERADRETILLFIADHEDTTSTEIAAALAMDKAIVEARLQELMRSRRVYATYAHGEEPEYCLDEIGRRHLTERGLP